jgi:DNA topoisomerase IA
MCKLHDCYFHFPPAGGKCKVVVTSVVGHCFGADFDDEDYANTHGDPCKLYHAKTRKMLEESTREHRVGEHLVRAALEAQKVGNTSAANKTRKFPPEQSFLYLWLDCDREGENICLEVMTILRAVGMFQKNENVYRAKFSAVTPKDCRLAFVRPSRPNQNESDAVEARQELDLKIGCSFTRFITRRFLGVCKLTYREPKLKVLSYGPCQTPTLYFCVVRAKEIAEFVPRPFWSLALLARIGGGDKTSGALDFVWRGAGVEKGGFSFDRSVAESALAAIEGIRAGRVVSIPSARRRMPPPLPLNTVALLRAASSGLGLSPVRTMQVAESLYTSGYISYPRTETTQYPSSFDPCVTLADHTGHSGWGGLARKACGGFGVSGDATKARKRGEDKGDHPPITPTRCVEMGGLKGGGLEWRIYELVCRHFIASLLADFVYVENKVVIAIGNDSSRGGRRNGNGGTRGKTSPEGKDGVCFEHVWHEVRDCGWTSAMPWRLFDLKLNMDDGDTNAERSHDFQLLAQLKKGDAAAVWGARMDEGETKPPLPLREAELIALMDKHGIGTDASIPQHIQTIQDRRYAQVCDAEGHVIRDDTRSDIGKGKGGKGKTQGQPCHEGEAGGSRTSGPSVKIRGGRGGGRRAGYGGGGSDSTMPAGRFMVPTRLGVGFISALSAVDLSLCQPAIRRGMEAELSTIVSGAAPKADVVRRSIDTWKRQYQMLAGGIDVMLPHFALPVEPYHEDANRRKQKIVVVVEPKERDAQDRGGNSKSVPGSLSASLRKMGSLRNVSDSMLRRADQEDEMASAAADLIEAKRREASCLKSEVQDGGGDGGGWFSGWWS